MIDSPLLALVARHIADVRVSGASAEEQHEEHLWLKRALATNVAPGQLSWRELLLDSYCGLGPHELASLPLRAHYFLIEQLPMPEWDVDILVRPEFFADLFDLLDPFGRYLTVKAVASRPESDEQLGALLLHVAQGTEERDRLSVRVQEIVDALLDLRLSDPIRDRNAQPRLERSSWHRALLEVIRLARRYEMNEAAEEAIRTRASGGGDEMARELRELLEDGDRFR